MAIAPGDIVEIDAEAAIGHEQQGRAPALVVSVEALQSTLGLAMVCAITTHGGRSEGARNACYAPSSRLPAVHSGKRCAQRAFVHAGRLKPDGCGAGIRQHDALAV